MEYWVSNFFLAYKIFAWAYVAFFGSEAFPLYVFILNEDVQGVRFTPMIGNTDFIEYCSDNRFFTCENGK